jgi:DNA-binding response OmpR family regulator
MRPSRDEVGAHPSPFTVVFVAENPVLAERIRSWAGSGIFSFRVVPRLREEQADIFVVPVHVLTRDGFGKRPLIAYGNAESISIAFLAGCEDYLKEPWDEEELAFRLERIARRLSVGFGWGFADSRAHAAVSPSGSVELSKHELSILKTLAVYRGDVVPKEALQYAAWGNLSPSSRRLDMCICSLRKKLAAIAPENGPENGEEHRIKTVYGEGYTLI